jgi:UDP-glucose 4-epimerase
MRFLVTGGAGFIGSNLANALSHETQNSSQYPAEQQLKSQGVNRINGERNNKTNDVIALDDLSLGISSNLSKEVKLVKGSVMDFDLVLELGKDCDYIFHQAALSSSPMFLNDPRKGIDTNVMGFMNVMESAKRNKVKRVIYASSSSIYNGLPMPYKESVNVAPKTFYESSFYCREVIAQTYNLEYGIESIGLRYFSVYGPNERHKGRFANNISQFIWDMVEKKSPIIYGDGTQTRDFTFVDDVVRANILAMGKQNSRSAGEGSDNDNDNDNAKGHWRKDILDSGFGVYNIGTGIQTSFNSVVEIINKLLGTDIRPTYTKNPINNYVQHTLADISLARLELGYEPKWRNVEEGIKQLLSQYRSSDSISTSRSSTSSSTSSSYPSIRI